MVRNKGLLRYIIPHIKQIFFVSYYWQGKEMKHTKKVRHSERTNYFAFVRKFVNRNGPILEDGQVPSRSCKEEEAATRGTINHQTRRQGLHNNAINKHNSSNLYRE